MASLPARSGPLAVLIVLLLAALPLGGALPGTSGPSAAAGPLHVIVVTEGEPAGVAAQAAALGAEVAWTYELIDAFAATVDARVLPSIAALPGVTEVREDRATGRSMIVSHQTIGAHKVHATGVTGAGVTVAVLDTGIDVLHPFFAGAIVACVSTMGGLETPECVDTDGHGTHVAGIVASRSAQYTGVAPGASLAAVRVQPRSPPS